MNNLDLQIANTLSGKEDIKPQVDLYDINEAKEYFTHIKNGTLPMGTPLQVPPLDTHFRYKQGNFVVVHGLDNVGKSTLCWWLCVLANVHNGVKPLLYCTENREQQVAKSIIQMRTGMPLEALNDLQYKKAHEWFRNNFGILRTNEDITLPEFLDVTGEACDKHGYGMVLGDPYNAFDMPDNANGHEYHLKCCNLIKKYCRESKVSMYLNVHPNTAAYRNIHRDGIFKGMVKPPTKGDIDGGAKFPAKADEYLTIHRYTEHPDLWMETAIYVRKVKDTETGGKVTSMDKPVLLRLNRNTIGFMYDSCQVGMEAENREGQNFIDPMQEHYLFNDEPKQREIKPMQELQKFPVADNNFESENSLDLREAKF